MKSNFLEPDFLSAKRIVVFGINRPLSAPTVNHIKQIDQNYDQLVAKGIDLVYCVDFGNAPMFDFLMPKLSKRINFVQYTEDSDIIKFRNYLNKIKQPVFLRQYWQFACVLNNAVVEYYVEQPVNPRIKILADTNQLIYSNVGPEKVLEYLGSRRLEA